MQGVIIAIYGFFGLLLLTIIIGAVFFAQRKTQEELDAKKGGLFKTDIAPSYEAKIQKNPALRRQSTLGNLVRDIA